MADQSATVRTTAGRVRGRREGELAVFRGIPFAAPPVGSARFAAPQPVDRWDGVREAVAFGPAPQQGTLSGATPPESAADDWLTVNVWTPEPDPAARRPVMVWIYGGAYAMGSSSFPDYDAAQLVGTGDLVVVTLNYRVGVEGFAQLAGAPANRSLLDQVAALEWVRDNVTAFGGDPAQVTIFGESAGAGSVAALLSMPRADGLFQRAIAQSVPGTYLSAELAADIAAEIAGELELPATAAELSAVEPRRLAAAGDRVATKMRLYEQRWGPVAHTLTPYSPVVDGEVLPRTPWQALAAGAARGVELIVGHTRDECRLFHYFTGLTGRVTDEQATAALRALAPGPEGERAYRAAFAGATAEQLFDLVHSDWLFRMPSLHLADAQVAGGGRAHLYELTWRAPGQPEVGACHALDVPLTFGVFASDLARTLLGAEPPPAAEALSNRVRAAWTDFARTGDPGWPGYDPQRRLTHLLDAEPAVVPYPEEASRQIWRDHTFAALPLL
ncbi:carboxylesterase/lipase family protein [Natronosporangium hydrolyticum]|uniref:Carboxylic ester hydrolase n=1 Tax=Natronosporangium hydrolyticum TaxID=2811111 RepID=A0A895YGP3_9ACTN|nr:carboxylesterase family protein [Natronosporangium hydrolyticum]QSB16731.1 carboxylesterase/lipase family protein [Natronosporangium hydrolyticum]